MLMVRANLLVLVLLLGIVFPPYGSSDEYTRIGAEAGGNASGEITAYVGGEGLECPKDAKIGWYLPNPYKDEEVLYRIDQTNVDQYKERLSPGQVARIKRNKNFYMNVYPTHRNVQFCEEFYQACERSREASYLDEKNMLQGFQGGVPFPFPKNGLEAIWNVKRPYYGDDTLGMNCRRVVSPSGKVKKSIWLTEVVTYDERRIKSRVENPENISYKIMTHYTYPADEKGTAFLTFGYLDDDRLEDAWIYMPTLRRVRRAPTLIGGGQLDGETTMDDLGWEFRGPVNDWEWKLLGKQEMYISANCYDMWGMGTPDEEECLPQDMNSSRIRYELRRVWVVEGTPRKGVEHPYSKRVGYYDEDTWLPAVADRYDKRGNLWRVFEFYSSYDYCQKMRVLPGTIYLNLESGRYELFGGCRTEDTYLAIYDTSLDESRFTVSTLRKAGR